MSAFIGTTATYRQGSRTLSGPYYTSPEIWEEELRRIFHRHWLCAGREAEIPSAGDYRLVDVAGESVIALRDRRGGVRAHHNVCRHRGARICREESGNVAETIQCPYHGWTYDLDGSLLHAPHMGEVERFRREDYPLAPVAAGVEQGFLFLSLAEEPEPLERWLSPLRGRFAHFGLAGLESRRRIEYDVRANWKLVFQNYSECLHCPVIHPGLTERSPYRSGENDLSEGPFLGGFMRLNPGWDSLTESGEACGLPVGSLDESDFGRVYYYSVFPNLLVSLHPDYVMFHVLWPEASDRTRIVCEWLFRPESRVDPGFDPDDAVEFWDTTNREDWSACERTHEGVSSRAFVPGPYSPRESLSFAWDREYLRRMGRER